MLLRSLLVLLACLSLAFAATPVPAGQVQLAWDAPVQADGTPIPNLAGYKLYYGSQSGQYPTMVPVGLTTTYTVTNVSVGQTSYFAVKAYDSTGTESAFSNEVSVTLGAIPQQQMRIVSVDSQELVGENGAATNAIDGNPATFWHTEWFQQTAPLPHTLVLDLGGQYQVDGWRYLPRQDGTPHQHLGQQGGRERRHILLGLRGHVHALREARQRFRLRRPPRLLRVRLGRRQTRRQLFEQLAPQIRRHGEGLLASLQRGALQAHEHRKLRVVLHLRPV